jgi:hypothetical protein
MNRFLLLFLCLFSVVPAFAQETTPTPAPVFSLQPGTVEGNINDSSPSVRYSFDANTGDSVSISMDSTSGDLDPLLFLYAPDGTLVERNDDRESGVRGALIALTLTQRGTYVIEATRFEQASVRTSGTFRLTLSISGTEGTDTPSDPLSTPPNFSVDFTQIDFGSVVAGIINSDASQRFYAIGGQQGDLIRVIMTRTNGDLAPRLRILNDRSVELSRETQTRAGESIAYVTLPQTGWYLVEAGRTDENSTGSFDLYATRLAAAVLQVGQQATGTFTSEAPSLSYIVNARIGDVITLTMFTTDAASAVHPQLELLDLSLNTVDRSTGERFVTLRTPIPRSGPYIVRATDLASQATAAGGGFNLRVTSTPSRNFTTQNVSYNNTYQGAISDDQPLSFYRFSGKTGELVTISMNASSGDLNAYLILMDNDLNELTSNDDVSTRRDSRITQYRLPKDGEYVIVASRSGLAAGASAGSYELEITAGEISLNSGAFTATLRWAGSADLNLFVRDPSGRTVSWSSPQIPDGGTLQIDSNTRCETPSDQPVEHAYWSSLIGGDYEVWAWFEDSCGILVGTAFTLDLAVNGAALPQIQGRLQNGERYSIGLRVTEDGQGFVVDPGAITTPSPQQRASEGGDLVIRYGETLNGTISPEVYALFYQFSGTAGDQVEIRAETASGDLDPILILRDAGDAPLPNGTNDDADETTRNSRLLYTLPADGQYVIAVTRFGVRDGTTTGDFSLSLTKVN